jgi:hypothetical protein
MQGTGITLYLGTIIYAVPVGICGKRIRSEIELRGVTQSIHVRISLARAERVEITAVGDFPGIRESIAIIIDSPWNVVGVGVKIQTFLEIDDS